MNPFPWRRQFQHPYVDNKKCAATHGSMKPRLLEIPPYTAIAVPFHWMLERQQKAIDEKLPVPLPPEEKAPFLSPWVFGKERQCALSEHVFGHLDENRSLVLFIPKRDIRLARVFVVCWWESERSLSSENSNDTTAPKDPRIRFGIVSYRTASRPDSAEGFLLPYHEYLAPSGDESEDERRKKGLLPEIIVAPEASHHHDYSYAAEIARADVAISALIQCLRAVRQIREHDIVAGPWQAREDWLNAQIAEVWQDRGRFPGAGAALEALGLRLGTALVLEMRAKGAITPYKNPWPAMASPVRKVKRHRLRRPTIRIWRWCGQFGRAFQQSEGRCSSCFPDLTLLHRRLSASLMLPSVGNVAASALAIPNSSPTHTFWRKTIWVMDSKSLLR